MTEPKVKVGILFEPEIEFVLLAPYRIDGCEVSGAQTGLIFIGSVRNINVFRGRSI